MYKVFENQGRVNSERLESSLKTPRNDASCVRARARTRARRTMLRKRQKAMQETRGPLLGYSQHVPTPFWGYADMLAGHPGVS